MLLTKPITLYLYNIDIGFWDILLFMYLNIMIDKLILLFTSFLFALRDRKL